MTSGSPSTELTLASSPLETFQQRHIPGDGRSLADIVRPMCKNTADFLRPWTIDPTDRLILEIQDDAHFLARIADHEGRNGSFMAQRWAAAIPECLYDPTVKPRGGYVVGATDMTALLIQASWRHDQVICTDDASALLDVLALRFLNQLCVARAQARFKESGELPAGLEPDPPSTGEDDYELARYQSLAAWCGWRSDGGFAYFMEQGTGKTPVQIRQVEMELDRASLDEPFRVVIVAPMNVLYNWGRELRKFARKKFRFILCRGDKVDRTKHVVDAIVSEKSEYDHVVVLVSFGGIRNTLAAFMAIQWDLAVIDESHNFKGRNTKLARCLFKLRDNSKKRSILTGTPIANSLMDLWTQLEFLGKGYSGFTTYDAFKRFHCSYYSNGAGFEKLLGYQNVPMLQERLTRFSFVIRLKEALPDLPDRTYDVLTCEMTDAQLEAYAAMMDELKCEIEDDLNQSDMPFAVVANNVLTKLLRLSQITSGFLNVPKVYDQDTGELLREGFVKEFSPNPKLEMLIQTAKDDPVTTKRVTWCTWTHDVLAATKALNDAGFRAAAYYGAVKMDDREEIQRLFNETYDLTDIVAQPKTLKEGVNLLGQCDEETNCDHNIVFSKNFSILERLQKLARSHRRGTRRPVRVTDLHCECPSLHVQCIDERVYEVLGEKEKCATDIQNLRDILKAVLNL